MSVENQAAIRIQKVYRMWKAKTLFQQLSEYKVQKQNQLIFFSEQVEVYGDELLEMIEQSNTPVSHRAQHRRASMDPPARHLLSYGEARTNQMERMSAMKQPWTQDDELYYRRLLADKNARNEHFASHAPESREPAIEIEDDEDTYSTKEALKEECGTEELLDRLEQDETNQRFRKWQALRRLIAFASGAAAAAAEARQTKGADDVDDEPESELEVAQAFFEKGQFTDASEVL